MRSAATSEVVNLCDEGEEKTLGKTCPLVKDRVPIVFHHH